MSCISLNLTVFSLKSQFHLSIFLFKFVLPCFPLRVQVLNPNIDKRSIILRWEFCLPNMLWGMFIPLVECRFSHLRVVSSSPSPFIQRSVLLLLSLNKKKKMYILSFHLDKKEYLATYDCIYCIFKNCKCAYLVNVGECCCLISLIGSEWNRRWLSQSSQVFFIMIFYWYLFFHSLVILLAIYNLYGLALLKMLLSSDSYIYYFTCWQLFHFSLNSK